MPETSTLRTSWWYAIPTMRTSIFQNLGLARFLKAITGGEQAKPSAACDRLIRASGLAFAPDNDAPAPRPPYGQVIPGDGLAPQVDELDGLAGYPPKAKSQACSKV